MNKQVWNVPAAHLRAPWYRRFAAWLTGSDVTTYCAQCHARLDVHADGVCFWCKSLAAQLADWQPRYTAPEPEMSVREASELLTDLRREINDARDAL